jgi:type II secretory pathway pseudopilin PulG
MMVTLLIMVITATAIMQSISNSQDPALYQQTQDRVQAIKNAIIHVQTVNGVPIVTGFAADMGRLPNNLQELLTYNGNTPNWAAGACYNISDTLQAYTDQQSCLTNSDKWIPVGYGWRGPYLQTAKNPTSDSDAFTDGWGRNYTEPYNPRSATCPNASYQLVLDIDNGEGCHLADTTNYGWYYSAPPLTDANNNANSYNAAAYLQSYGSDRLPDYVHFTTNTYEQDYPANIIQPGTSENPAPLMQPSDWLFNLGNMPISLALNNGQQFVQPASIAVNFSRTQPSPSTIYAQSSSDVPTVCSMVGGTWNGSPAQCIINSTVCGVLGGTWNGPSSVSGTCTLTQLPLASLCTSVAANGSWSSTLNQCTLTSLTQAVCNNNNASASGFTASPYNYNLNGTFSSPNCALPVSPTLAVFCSTTYPSGWTIPKCTLPTVLFQTIGDLTASNGFCAAIGGYVYTGGSTNSPGCFITAPLLPVSPAACTSSTSQCQQNVCLTVFYRIPSSNLPYPPQLALAWPITSTSPASPSPTVMNDGQPHAVNFSSGFAANTVTGIPLVPAGQNAISVTQADPGGQCSGTSWTNPVYPANHAPGPIPQTFLPGQPLIFNW